MSRPLLPVTAALLLAGCAAIPKLGEAPVAKPASAYATAQSLAAPAADWPTDQWWKAYGDPQLDKLVDEALAGSPTLAQAEARVRQAQARAQQSRAATLPTLDLNAQAAELRRAGRATANSDLATAAMALQAYLAGLSDDSMLTWSGLTPHTDKLLTFMPKKEAARRPVAA